MKKSVLIYLCLTLAAFSFFSCASKETEIPENLIQDLSEPETTETVPEDISEDSENEALTESDIALENSEEKTETSEDLTSVEENSETESFESENDEVSDCDEIEELEEIIEPEVFEEELPPEEPEIISSETTDQEQSSEKEAEPLTEEETTEIEELPEIITEIITNDQASDALDTELTEASMGQDNNDSSNEIDEIIEISNDQVDEVESLEESSTDEEDKISEEEEKVEIIPSRSVTLKKGEILEVSYPGKGWIFLGATDGSKNLTSTGRKTNVKTTDFSLMARVSGTVILHFYKEDILADKYIDDYLEVTVQDIKSKSTVHVKAPSYAEKVPAKPETKTEPETETQEKTEPVPQIPKTEPVKEAPKTEPVKPVEKPVLKQDSEIKNIQQNQVLEIQDFEKNTLSAEDYLLRAKKALDEKKFTEGYNNLQNFLLLAETNRDEGLFLLAQLFEGNSEYRNIKKSVETYEELTNSYPLSKYWDDANKRVIYLKRFYINIR